MSNSDNRPFPTSDRLTKGNLLARNTILNLLGQGTPLIIAIFAIPILIKNLGKDAFGVLTLVWAITAYCNLFDLGMGRALTQKVADRLGKEKHQEIPGLVWTALLTMLLLGVLGTTVLIPLSSWMVHSLLKIPPPLQLEARNSFYLIAIFLPIIISTPTLRGLLEAHQRFDITSAMNVSLGVYTFLSPLLVILFSRRLFPIVAVLVVGRLIAWGVYVLLCRKIVPALTRGIRVQMTALLPLACYGGWLTVSNIFGSLMIYSDRFIIGAILSMAAVAFYATPFEVITKLGLLPFAIVGVLFPAFSVSFFHDQERAGRLFRKGVKSIFLVLFPISLLLVTFAYEALSLWLGVEFAQNSTRVVQWLTVGILINSLAFVPVALFQGIGRPDLIAKLHLCEFPLYLMVMWLLIKAFGIEGAAVAWVLRVTVDAFLLFYLTQRLLPFPKLTLKSMALALVLALLTLGLASLLGGQMVKALFVSAAMVIFCLCTWVFILSPEERMQMLEYKRILHGKGLLDSH